MTTTFLLNEVKDYIRNSDYMKYKRNYATNIFCLLDIERNEVGTHSKMIHALLNPHIGHGMSDTFLKLFLKNIGLDQDKIDMKWKVEREFSFEYGRIDFLIKNSKMCIAVEMKIDAGDQLRQLKRYEEYAKSACKEYAVYYLTIDGKDPSQQSIDGIDSTFFHKLSFKKNIKSWLSDCLEATSQNAQVYSFIKQYSDLVEKIVVEENMMNTIKELINNSETLQSAIVISKALNEIKTDVLMNFMNAMNCCFEQKNSRTA